MANDPDAAKIVFNSLPRIIMSPLDVTHQVRLKPLCVSISKVNDAGYFLDLISQHYIKVLDAWGVTEWPVHDACAVMALARPDLFVGSSVCVDVETQGELTLGATVADWKGHWGRESQTNALLKVDDSEFRAYYLEMIRNIRYSNPVPALRKPAHFKESRPGRATNRVSEAVMNMRARHTGQFIERVKFDAQHEKGVTGRPLTGP